jgi:hypothetical protein
MAINHTKKTLINSWLIRPSVDNVLLINTRILSITIDTSIPLSIGIPIVETCSGVQEINITACSLEAVLRTVATRVRAVCGVHSAQDFYAHLEALQEGARRCPVSKIRSLLGASHPLLALDQEFPFGKNALFRSVESGSLFRTYNVEDTQ